MSNKFRMLFGLTFIMLPIICLSQITPPKADSVKTIIDTLSRVQVDTVKVVIDTVIKKDCYTEYYDIMRTRGAKPVPDGMQQVVIALKSGESCHCLMGQIEVVNGKMKAPLYFQQENGEYKAVSTMNKKLEPAFVASMTMDELYTIKDGMSIVFRTSDSEYGRLFFYKFVNKGGQNNKTAPSAADLFKD